MTRVALLALLAGCHLAFGVDEIGHDAAIDAPTAGRWAQVAVGGIHVCAIDTDAHLWCWGSDDHGQLGAAGNTSTPREVLPGVTWTAIAAGDRQTCGLREGDAWCWGANPNGQVTGAITADVQVPTLVPVVGAPAFETIAVGAIQSCALGAGQLWCWGSAQAAGHSDTSSAPARVPGTWTAMATGFDHTCAIDDAGMARCWGGDAFGQLGLGTTPSSTPMIVGGLPAPVTAIGAGKYASCAVAAGQAWCWGRDRGVLDSDPSDHPQPPKRVADGDDWTSIVVGNNLACGTRPDGTRCWGSPAFGGLGDGAWRELVAPASAMAAARDDATSLAHSYQDEEAGCAIRGGHLRCWGDNRGDALGLGQPSAAFTPIEIAVPSGGSWIRVQTSDDHTCAVDRTGTGYCWGADDAGQVSGTPGADRPRPTAVPMAGPIEDLVPGNGFTCGRSGTTVACWGSNASAQLGLVDPSVHASTVPIASVTGLTGGTTAMCGLRGATPPLCWGLIDGTAQVPASLDLKLSSATLGVHFGRISGCGWSQDQRSCFGHNSHGELGNNMTSDAEAPPAAVGGGTMHDLALSYEHVCLAQAGGIACFGTNFDLESGAPSGSTAANPVPVRDATSAALAGCTAVATGTAFSCGICNAVPLCWGGANGGALGAGDSKNDRATAQQVQVTAGLTWTSLAGAGLHACALASDGTLACWGLGVRGEVGAGGRGSASPIDIP